jgi:hypothetical protein
MLRSSAFRLDLATLLYQLDGNFGLALVVIFDLFIEAPQILANQCVSLRMRE